MYILKTIKSNKMIDTVHSDIYLVHSSFVTQNTQFRLLASCIIIKQISNS
jgi:hypothetical protein